MTAAFRKHIFREITQTIGRYLALLAIVALGVGFFAGLSVCQDAMLETGNRYVTQYALYDYRLLSTLGISEADVQSFAALPGVKAAEGAYQLDVLAQKEGAQLCAMRLHSMMRQINQLQVLAGTLPQNPGECAGDSRYFDESDLGKTITISEENDAATLETLAQTTFRLTAIVSTPYYINFERGTTTVGNGNLSCFIYLMRETFLPETDTELFLTLTSGGFLYSDEYRQAVRDAETSVQACLSKCTERRKQEIKDALAQKMQPLLQNLASAGIAAYEGDSTDFLSLRKYFAQTEQTLQGLSALFPPETDNGARISQALNAIAQVQTAMDSTEATIASVNTYVLTRDANVGYVCFENDAQIVNGIAKVFPLFFFLVAALICMTTMTRMVEDQRTQIGVCKALGFRGQEIAWKYLFYAGSAAILGSVGGFFLGTYAMPAVIWKAYNLMYGFSDRISYVFSLPLFCISLVAALLCCVGTTLLCCVSALKEEPAALMRPRAPQNGKRLLIEHFTKIWKKVKFLHKVSIRNIFRYKKRLIMMMLGIGGCTALLLTGFGIRDSISDLMTYQYDEILHYDYEITFAKALDDTTKERFLSENEDFVRKVAFLSQNAADALQADGKVKSVRLCGVDETIMHVIDFHRRKAPVAYPGTGQAILSDALAKSLNIGIGDTVTVRLSDMTECTFTVSGVFDNYIYNYVFVNLDDLKDTTVEVKTAYLAAQDGVNLQSFAAQLGAQENVGAVVVNADMRVRVDQMMKSMDAIVWMVLVCAGALALIVLYNLTNINITERIREIATIRVLGFTNLETASYVFRENLILTAFGVILGIPLGILLHRFVMTQIQIDMISFDVRILPLSYGLSVVLTFFFAALVNLIMRRKLRKINMAEALKSVE